MIAARVNYREVIMANFNARQSGPAQAARPSAAEAKAAEERYSTFQSRMSKLAEAASKAGRTTLANQLVDLGQRVEDREITLEEGMAELRDYEKEIRAMLKR
jgi:phage shock protein A